jgi:hypothetical protein
MGRSDHKQLSIVVIDYPLGFAADTFEVVQTLVHDARAAYLVFLQPGTWLLCFKPTKTARAEAVVARVHELRETDARFKAIGAATQICNVVYKSDFWGRVRSLPLGADVNAVSRQAAADAAG